MSKILVTGANGFVGRALGHELEARSLGVVKAVRGPAASGEVAVGDLDGSNDWLAALAGCDAVVHLAARVHVMNDDSSDPLAAYRSVNVDATINLARQAAAAGVRRFVFVSSIKVNGEGEEVRPYSASDAPAPTDPYGVSKWEAEQALWQLSRDTGLEVVVVRPPLVYGPGVKANFLNMMRLVASGLPLPLGAVRNARSMVALENLVDLLIRCVQHPAAKGRTFLVSDGDDLSVAQLARFMGKAMPRPPALLPIPTSLMTLCATLLGKKAVAQRMFGSLQVDISATTSTLEWTPPVTPDLAVAQCMRHYLESRNKPTK